MCEVRDNSFARQFSLFIAVKAPEFRLKLSSRPCRAWMFCSNDLLRCHRNRNAALDSPSWISPRRLARWPRRRCCTGPRRFLQAPAAAAAQFRSYTPRAWRWWRVIAERMHYGHRRTESTNAGWDSADAPCSSACNRSGTSTTFLQSLR